MDPLIYQVQIIIQPNGGKNDYLNIEEKMNHYFEEHKELCAYPILRVYDYMPNIIFLSIPFDNYCKMAIFEKESLKLFALIEELGNCKIVSGYINLFEVFHVEDPIQCKYLLKRKDEKVILTKQTYKRDIYNKMKNYLRKSTPENSAFLDSLLKDA